MSRSWARQLPWIDCLAALTVGLLVLAFHEFLAQLYNLPKGVVLFIGVANSAYSTFGLVLGIRRTRKALVALVVANGSWPIVCAGLAIGHGTEASFFGLGHLIGEGLIVGVLAAIEWRNREVILRA